MDLDFKELAKSGWIAVAAILAWVGRGHMSHDARVAEAVFGRLSKLEQDTVTKDDLHHLDTKIDQVLMMLAGRPQP